MGKNAQISELINYISVDGSGNIVMTGNLLMPGGAQAATQTYVTTNFLAKTGGTLTGTNNVGLKIKQGNQIGDTVTSANFFNGLVLENSTTTNAWGIGYSQGAKLSINYYDGSSAYSRRFDMSPAGEVVFIANDTTGNRINPFNVFTITADNNSNPYNGFGAALVFRNTIYSGGPSLGGIRDGARIRTSINTNSTDALGTDLVFDVTATQNGSFSTAMTLRYNGNVGIGTTSPNTQLNIGHNGHGIGLSYLSNAALPALAGLYTSDGTVGGGGYGALLVKARTDYGGIYHIGFYTATSDNVPVERMRLTAGGNLAIGTISPVTFTNYNTVSVNGSTGGAFVTMSNGASALRLACGASDSALWEARNVPVMFGMNNEERMRLQTDGFVRFGVNQANTLIASTGTNGTIYMYQNGAPKIYLETSGSVIFNNTNGVMINNTTPVGRLHISGALTISNNNQTWRRVLTTHGQAGTYSQVKVFFNKSNWGSVTYDIKLGSAGGSYHTAGAYYSNPGFSSHVNSISAGNGISVSLEANSQTGSTQGAIWTFSGATMIHPSLTVDISCGNGYMVDPNDIVVQFI